MKQRTYLAIDLKSFYASVECRERGLDPLNTNLVVADESRTDKTICLAVTPTLKSYGISGRGRLFKVRQRVREVNAWRQARAPGRTLTGSSHQFSELQRDPALAVDFVIAPPRMAYYMEYSTRIYEIYRKYIAPEDIVVAADTIVVVDGAVLGKPHDEEEAFRMLKTLSGRGHEVMTGLNVWHEGKLRQEVVRTRVHFRPMTDAEIRAYIATGEPMDKAGSYGIQGYGAIFVDHLEGDYFSVMGLPLCALARMLAECGVSILREKEAPEG